MPRRTPVKELLKEEEVPSSPLRRSSRITNSSTAPMKLITRRNSSSESNTSTSTSTSTPKATRGRRSSFNQEPEPTDDAQDDKKQSSTVRTRRGSLTSQNENRPNQEPVQKGRTRGSSVPKDQKSTEVKKTTRRRRSVSEDREEEESVNSRGGSSSKKTDNRGVKNSKDVPLSTPIKKVVSPENFSGTLQPIEEGCRETNSPDKVTSTTTTKKRTDVIKIDLDLSVINETSLTEEEVVSPLKKNKIDEESTDGSLVDKKKNEEAPSQASPPVNNLNTDKIPLEENVNVESPTKESLQRKDTETEIFSSTMSETSFKLQLSSSAVEDDDQNEADAAVASNKENIRPQMQEVEPMDVDEPEIEISSEKTLSLVKKIEHKLQVSEKITEEIDRFLKEENRFSSPSGDQESEEIQNLHNGSFETDFKCDKINGMKDETTSPMVHPAIGIEATGEEDGENLPKLGEIMSEFGASGSDNNNKAIVQSPTKYKNTSVEEETSPETIAISTSDSPTQTESNTEEEEKDPSPSNQIGKDSVKVEDCPVSEQITESNARGDSEDEESAIQEPILPEVEARDEEELSETVQSNSAHGNLETKIDISAAENLQTATITEQESEKICNQPTSEPDLNVDIESTQSTTVIGEKVEEGENLCSTTTESCENNEERDDTSTMETNAEKTNRSLDVSSSENQNSRLEEELDRDQIQLDENEIPNVNNADDGEENSIKKDAAKAKSAERGDDSSILSNSFRTRSHDRTLITLHETVKAGEDKEKTVSERIHKVVDLFCAGIKNDTDVSINVSMEYSGQMSDSEDDKADVLEVSLIASVDPLQKAFEVANEKGSKRRKICHEADLQSTRNVDNNQTDEENHLSAKSDVSVKGDDETDDTSESKDIEVDESSDNEMSQSQEASEYNTLLEASLEDSDDNDASWKPQEEKGQEESDTDDSDDYFEESFMKEIQTKQSSLETSKRRKYVLQTTNEASPRRRNSVTTNETDSPKSKISFEKESQKKNEKRRSDCSGEANTNTASPKKKINVTPFKRTNIEISSEDEVNSDGNEDSEDLEVGQDSECATLLGASFEDSDANDTTWKPDNVIELDTEGSLSSEEEEEKEEEEEYIIQKTVSNDSVFEDQDKEVTEKKTKKRKILHLSKMNMSKVLGSSDSEKSESSEKKTKKANQQREIKKKNKQKSGAFHEMKSVKNMVPERSEVKRKNKKRKHSAVEDQAGLPFKTKAEGGFITDLREKIHHLKSKRSETTNLYMKPSKKAASGWSVSVL